MGFKNKKALSKLYAIDRNFLKTFGQQHPINDIEYEPWLNQFKWGLENHIFNFSAATLKSIQVVEDRSDEEEDVRQKHHKRPFDPVLFTLLRKNRINKSFVWIY